MTTWMRSIASVTKSAGYFGNNLVKAQTDGLKYKSRLMYSGMILGGSVLRLGARVIDSVGSRLVNKPKKGWGKKKSPSRSKSSKPYSRKQEVKDVKKEIAREKRGLKPKANNQKEGQYYVPGNLEPSKVKGDVPSYELSEKEKEALSEWSAFNEREIEGDTNNYKNMSDAMAELYQYLERTTPFIEKLHYDVENKVAEVTLKKTTVADMGFLTTLLLTPNSIQNEEGMNYFVKDPSEAMTKLLNDYHIEQANILYLIINHYYGKKKSN